MIEDKYHLFSCINRLRDAFILPILSILAMSSFGFLCFTGTQNVKRRTLILGRIEK